MIINNEIISKKAIDELNEAIKTYDRKYLIVNQYYQMLPEMIKSISLYCDIKDCIANIDPECNSVEVYEAINDLQFTLKHKIRDNYKYALSGLYNINNDYSGKLTALLGSLGFTGAVHDTTVELTKMFAKASTGTPISVLTGAASDKAVYAALGGGSLAAGGGGILAGVKNLFSLDVLGTILAIMFLLCSENKNSYTIDEEFILGMTDAIYQDCDILTDKYNKIPHYITQCKKDSKLILDSFVDDIEICSVDFSCAYCSYIKNLSSATDLLIK